MSVFNLCYAQIPQRVSGGLHRILRRIFPGVRARSDDLHDFVNRASNSGLFSHDDLLLLVYCCPKSDYAAFLACLVFVKSGGRFSMKAVNASFASAERPRTENSPFSHLAASSLWFRIESLPLLLHAGQSLPSFSATAHL